VVGLFTLGNGTYYDVSTTATVLGDIEICITYDEATLLVPEADLRLLHWDRQLNPDAWVDITTSLDLGGNKLCGVSNHLSPFTLAAEVVTDVGATPRTLALRQNVPNPFNPNTTIQYDVPAGGADVSITIYDVTGRLVRTLVDERRSAGTHDLGRVGRVLLSDGIGFFRRIAAHGPVEVSISTEECRTAVPMRPRSTRPERFLPAGDRWSGFDTRGS
jgi:hypothetical protein